MTPLVDMGGPDLLLLAALAAALALAALAARRDLALPVSFGAPALVGVVAAGAAAGQLLAMDWRAGAALAALLAICALIAEIDRRSFIIPDPLVAGLFALAVARAFGVIWQEAMAGALILGGLLLGVRFWFERMGRAEALGLGDVKLAAAMGALLGPQYGLLAVALAGVATLSVAAPALARGGAPRAARLPFGIGLAAALAVLASLRLWGPTW